MDNFYIDLVAREEQSLMDGMKLAFWNAPGGKATHYCIHPEQGLIFLWHDDQIYLGSQVLTVNKLIFPADSDVATRIASGWLECQDFGPGPDIDGSAEHGFRLYNALECCAYAIVAVQPAWALYGK